MSTVIKPLMPETESMVAAVMVALLRTVIVAAAVICSASIKMERGQVTVALPTITTMLALDCTFTMVLPLGVGIVATAPLRMDTLTSPQDVHAVKEALNVSCEPDETVRVRLPSALLLTKLLMGVVVEVFTRLAVVTQDGASSCKKSCATVPMKLFTALTTRLWRGEVPTELDRMVRTIPPLVTSTSALATAPRVKLTLPPAVTVVSRVDARVAMTSSMMPPWTVRLTVA